MKRPHALWGAAPLAVGLGGVTTRRPTQAELNLVSPGRLEQLSGRRAPTPRPAARRAARLTAVRGSA
jgi:hypothetical protein